MSPSHLRTLLTVCFVLLCSHCVRVNRERVALTSPRVALDYRNALVVGNEQALLLWSIDGSSHYTLSEGAALHPRRVAEDAVLVVRAESANLQRGALLERISLIDGSRVAVATLPAFACANGTEEELLGLDVQEPYDFVVDPQGKRAYLTLMDRNANMADVQLKVRVELDSGRVARWQTLGEPECLPPPGVSPGDPDEDQWHTLTLRSSTEATARKYTFDFDSESSWVLKSGEPATHLPDYLAEGASPSGRWLVLGGELQEGDYIHRNLLLLDREDGNVYPILEQPGPWPAPLAAAKRAVKVPESGMADVVGESDVRWLSFSESVELLIVDQLVVQPAKRSWAFEGQLAR